MQRIYAYRNKRVEIMNMAAFDMVESALSLVLWGKGI